MCIVRDFVDDFDGFVLIMDDFIFWGIFGVDVRF